MFIRTDEYLEDNLACYIFQDFGPSYINSIGPTPFRNFIWKLFAHKNEPLNF
jgi:hypothetical protein